MIEQTIGQVYQLTLDLQTTMMCTQFKIDRINHIPLLYILVLEVVHLQTVRNFAYRQDDQPLV
jgi:hypothetical protein